MPFALPLVGAAIGGFVAPGIVAFGMTGAQIGWMVGAAIWSAVQPTPTIRAGDPSTAPQVGSDIRGQTIPAIYGTVRTPGYLVWQSGFQANKQTRKVGRGKKKQKQEYYTYTWDFIFHMGMATTDYKLIGMWEGSERIQTDSLASVTMADGSVFAPGARFERTKTVQRFVGRAGFFSFQERETIVAGKSAEWAEAYFFGAHATTSSRQGWAHFQTAAPAAGVRWPHTIWAGFKQYDLGQQPRIPQLNFEVQPDIPVTAQGSWSGTVASSYGTAATGAIPVGVTVGSKFAVFFSISNVVVLRVTNTTTGAQVTSKTGAEIFADFPEISPGSDNDVVGVNIVPGTSYIAVTYSGSGGSNAQNYLCVCFYLVDPETGALSPAGVIRGNSNLAGWWVEVLCVGLSRDQKKFYIMGNRTSNGQTQICVADFPPSNGGANVSISWAEAGANRISAGIGNDMGTSDETFGALTPNNGFFGFIVPDNTDTGARFFGYVSRARIRWGIANPGLENSYIAANRTANPNGWVFVLGLSASPSTTLPSIANSSFNSNGPPFDDEAEDADGTAQITWTSGFDQVGYTDRFCVAPCNLTSPTSNWVIAFHRQLSTANNTAKGARCTVRLFEYSPTNNNFTYMTQIDADMEDVAVQYNISPSGRFSVLQDSDALVAYDAATGRLTRLGNRNSGAQSWLYHAYLGTVICGIIDYTPPEIIRDMFVNGVMGQAQPASSIDTLSYDQAVAFCREKGIFISAVFMTSQPRNAVFEQLANVYGGWVAWTGTRLRFGKPEEVLTPVRTITLPNFRQDNEDDPKPPVHQTKMAIQDTVNRVTVRFQDRALAYRNNEVTLNDEVDQDLNGVRQRIIDTGMVMSKETAYRLAERLLWGNLYARSVFSKVPVGWKDADLEPGDIVRVIDPDANIDKICRIARREEAKRGQFDLDLVEEFEFLAQSKPIFQDTIPSQRTLSANTDRPLDFEMYELPSEFSPEGSRYFVGWAPGGASAGAGLYTSASTIGFRLAQSVVPYPDGGYLRTMLPPDSNVALDVDVVINVRSSANVNSPTFWLAGGQLEDYSPIDRAAGLSVFRIGSEMLSYERATLVNTNVWRLSRVFRGVGGTPISAHSPGAVFWTHDPQDGGGLFTIPYAQAAIGTTIYYKVVPVGFDNVPFDVDSVPYKQFTLTGQHFAPAAMNDIRVLVGSPSATLPNTLPVAQEVWGATSLYHLGPWNTRNVGSGPERNITIVWPETSRTSGYGVGGYDVYGYGFFVQDVPANQWRVTVIGSGGVAVASAVVNSPFYSYDALTNAANNGAWRGNVAFQVQPFNPFASAPFAATRSLELQG